MALNTSLISIPFVKGMDSYTDEFLVDPLTLISVNNAVYTKAGLIKKRFGFSSIPTNISGSTVKITDSKVLANYNSDLVSLTPTNLYSYNDNQQDWIDKGTYSTLAVVSNPIARTNKSQVHFDYAENGDYYITVWHDTTGVYYSVYDTSTNANIINNQVVQVNITGVVALNPKVRAIGRSFVITYWTQETGVGDFLRCKTLQIANPKTLITPSTYLYFTSSLASDSALPYEVVSCRNVLLVVNNESGSTMKLTYVLETGEKGDGINHPNAFNTNAGDYFSKSLAVTVVGNVIILVGRQSVSTNKFLVLKSNLSNASTDYKVVASPFTALLGDKLASIIQDTDGTFYVADSPTAANPLVNAYISTWNFSMIGLAADNLATVAATLIGSVTTKLGMEIASNLFLQDSKVYFLASYQGAVADIDNIQPTHFVFDSDFNILGKLLPGIAGNHVSSLPYVIGNRTVMGARTKIQNQGLFTIPTGITHIAFTFNNSAFDSSQLGENLHVAGGFVYDYDGQNVVEHGFHLFPEKPTITLSTGGSLDNSSSSYQYVAVYEWVDAKGQVHQSAPSLPATILVTSTDRTANVVVYKLIATNKTNVDIVLYRTSANGTIFNRVTTISNDYGSYAYVTFVDGTADTGIAANQLLYTTGGIIENIAPPFASIIERHKNRIFLAGLEDQSTIWFSKESVVGEGVAFSDLFQFRINPEGGAVTALGSLDSNLIIFKNNAIYAMSGEGPTDTGINSDYTNPQIITSNIGCQNSNSIVNIPEGIMFRSNKGVWLLNRSLSLEYIGAPVEKYNNLTVTSAISLPDVNQVRFTTLDGQALIYNNFLKLWSTFTNYKALSATTWLNDYYFIDALGNIQKEVQNQFHDNNGFFPISITTAWIKIDIQGRFRMYHMGTLGRFTGSPIMKITKYSDYDENTPEFRFFKTDEAYGIDTIPFEQSEVYWGTSTTYGSEYERTYQFIAHWDRQKLNAVKFIFEDVQSTTLASSFELSNLTLQIGQKPGIMHKDRGAR